MDTDTFKKLIDLASNPLAAQRVLIEDLKAIMARSKATLKECTEAE